MKEEKEMLFKSKSARRACVIVGSKKCAGVGVRKKKVRV